MEIAVILLYLGIPVVLLALRNRVKAIDKLGAVTIAYILGVLIGNSGVISETNQAAETVLGPAVILSIPLLLFGTKFHVFKKAGPKLLMSFGCCIVAVLIASTSAAFLFESWFDKVWMYSAMTFGVYTGGTVNLSAIGLALNAPKESIILISAADLAWGGLILIVLFTVAKTLLQRILGAKCEREGEISQEKVESLDDSFDAKGSPLGLLLAILVAGLAAGASWFVTGRISELIMYVGVTAFALLFALIPRVNQLKGTYAMGNYLLVVFCLAIGSLANIHRIVEAGADVITFVGYVVFLTMIIHVMLSRLLRIDADSVIITSTAGLFGPPFIAPVARAIKAESLIPIGITLSLIGFAIGNYGGLLLGHMLKNFFV